MARNQLTGDVEFVAAGVNGALPPMNADAYPPDAEPLDVNEEPVMVNTYDANGEAIEVPASSAQAPQELPGFDDVALEAWPRFEGRRVSEVLLAFAGQCEIPRGLSYELGSRLTLAISGTVASVKHASKESRGPVRAIVALTVDDSDAGDDEGEADDLRDRIQAALSEIEDARVGFGDDGDGLTDDEFVVRSGAVAWCDRLTAILNGTSEAAAIATAQPYLTRQERREDDEGREYAASLAGMGEGADVGDVAEPSVLDAALAEVLGEAGVERDGR